MVEERNNAVVYEISDRHLYKLMSSTMGKTWCKGSLYYGDVDEEVVDPEDFNEEDYRSLVSNKDFMTVATILTEPDHYVVQRVGGSSIVLDNAIVYHRSDMGDQVVLISKNVEDGVYLVRHFEEFVEYTDWWLETFGCLNEEATPNYMPPHIPLSQFYILLHFIDCFRRISYMNQLEFEYSEVPAMDSAEFMDTMVRSMASKDLRWLMPSVDVLIPSVDGYEVGFEPEDLKVLLDRDFADGIDTSDGRNDLVFGAVGILQGMEFMHNWSVSLGFEFFTVHSQEPNLEKMLYVASTAVSNHFVWIDEVNGRPMVNHQVYARTLAGLKFNEQMVKVFSIEPSLTPEPAVKATPEPVGLATPEPAAPIASQVKQSAGRKVFCTQCGTRLDPAAKFCFNCGSPQK